MFIKPQIELPWENNNDIYVVADFDRTITDEASQTSWNILSNSNLVSECYRADVKKLYEQYRPIEIDESLPLEYRISKIEEWFYRNIELLVQYQMKESIFQEIAQNPDVMMFRNGAQEFLSFLNKNQIPLVIMSAGVGNFIEMFLKQNQCDFGNISIISNQVAFENGIAKGLQNSAIHSFNKSEMSMSPDILKKLQRRNRVILLGDQLSDLSMVDRKNHEEVLTVGFLPTENHSNLEQFKSNFDIVCETKEDYKVLQKTLFSKK